MFINYACMYTFILSLSLSIIAQFLFICLFVVCMMEILLGQMGIIHSFVIVCMYIVLNLVSFIACQSEVFKTLEKFKFIFKVHVLEIFSNKSLHNFIECINYCYKYIRSIITNSLL